ncbi:acyl-CoA/acyl-ACP dehydrogenase [Saccharopolyspora sp. HNM0983]|uniref:Acyl-CoA/acyl-ACP dehydrogenase n=1 Tax=Saccharopolyspora montiporae TaxID=2781240 RepID=A0A929G284_9PSEU|nr:acyl-CoA dehydrogenase family protein [Saccharopolyspora sp. HNM0983]MBE9375503.1 acyl-CoA/acyl-ACP dehydrogenase [Saccharopolyspora sp. HNM0983]
MDFTFTDEQRQLQEIAGKLAARSGHPRVLPPEDTSSAFDEQTWQLLSEQLGAPSLAVPERFDGAGYGLLESMIVLEALGAQLVPGPFLGSPILTAQAVLATGDEQAGQRLLPGIASGERIAALAWSEPGNDWPEGGFDCTATERDGEWSLTGHKVHVLDAARADVLLVAAEAAGTGPALFELTAPARTTASVPMDRTRELGEVRLDAAPARLLGSAGCGAAVLRRCRAVAAAAVATEQIGAARRWLPEIVAYTKTREQFGRPIGSFQALKHRLADCHVATEAAYSLCWAANWAVSTGDEQAEQLASMAKSACCEAYSAVAAEGVQMHGGLGITWEHEAHLHLKRAHSGQQLFGTPRRHRELLHRG